MEARGRAWPCHYKHGPCQLTGVFGFWQGMGWHGRATAGMSLAKLLAVWAQKKIFSFFLNLARTISYKTT